jgi:hypothetical protein
VASSADRYKQSIGTANSDNPSRGHSNVRSPLTGSTPLMVFCVVWIVFQFYPSHLNVEDLTHVLITLLTGNCLRNKILKHWHDVTAHRVSSAVSTRNERIWGTSVCLSVCPLSSHVSYLVLLTNRYRLLLVLAVYNRSLCGEFNFVSRQPKISHTLCPA